MPVESEIKFEINRHTDRSYAPPAPWDQWDSYAGCWTCNRCGAAAGFQLHNPLCGAVPHADAAAACSCFGCTVERSRAGIPAPDRSAEPCDPPDACGKDGQCWTHSEWIDEAACDPPGACASRIVCVAHGGAAGKGPSTAALIGHHLIEAIRHLSAAAELSRELGREDADELAMSLARTVEAVRDVRGDVEEGRAP